MSSCTRRATRARVRSWHSRVPLAVGPHPDDLRAGPPAAGRDGLLQFGRSGCVGEAQSVQLRRVPEVESVRRRKVRRECRLEVADGEHVKDAAPVVVHQDEDDVERPVARGQEAVQVMVEGDVADQRHHRAGTAPRAPHHRRYDAVDPARAPVAEDLDVQRGRAAVPVDVADRHGGGYEQRCAGWEGAERGGRAGALVIRVGKVILDGRPGGRFDLRPLARPRGVGGRVTVPALGQPVEHPSGRRVQVVLGEALVVLAVCPVVDHDLRGPVPAFEGALQRSRSRGAADPDDQVGVQPAKHLVVAQEMVVRPQDRGRCGLAEAALETGTGERVGERRRSRARGEADHRRTVQTGIGDGTPRPGAVAGRSPGGAPAAYPGRVRAHAGHPPRPRPLLCHVRSLPRPR